MKQVRVPLGTRSYKITIGRGALSQLKSGLKKVLPSNRLVVLTNKTISRLYGRKLKKALPVGSDVSWIVIPDGEKYKNLKTMETIYHQLSKCKADRKTGLIAFGGGVVGDMAGFAASSYLRGMPYIQIPTSLLAQVDSSVGGKTGVDLPSGKNLVGAFYQPKWVLIDIDLLKTLPKREFLCGLSEVVKYGILWDEKFFSYLEKNIGKILKLNHNVLEHIIARCCAIKAEIVSRDEKEAGLRSILNLGHTLGHAIETLSGYSKIRHGEAISRGMVYALMFSYEKDLCSLEVIGRVTDLLKKIGLPIECPYYSKQKYAKVIALDKKAEGKRIRFIVVKKIGKVAPLELPISDVVQYL